MHKILLGGAGGAPTENVIQSLILDGHKEKLIGMGSIETDLYQSAADTKYLVPFANEPHYKEKLFAVLEKEKPNFAHFQNDLEIAVISPWREEIESKGTKLFLPADQTIQTCVDKWESYKVWKKNEVNVPESLLIKNRQDLKTAFDQLGDKDGFIWIRALKGGGGRGALPTNDFHLAEKWIDRYDAWGEFMAAEQLSADTVTWLSLWHEGKLIVAQGRKRHSWGYGSRALSGVTGITAVGETCSESGVDKLAQKAISAIDSNPHGLFGVDMTYDHNGNARLTEINIARFFTTVFFFAKAGLNMPAMYKNIALYDRFPELNANINPLEDGLVWFRGMDREPKLSTFEEMHKNIDQV